MEIVWWVKKRYMMQVIGTRLIRDCENVEMLISNDNRIGLVRSIYIVNAYGPTS